MGLLDFLKKKTEMHPQASDRPDITSSPTDNEKMSVIEFTRFLTETVALRVHDMKITSQPSLRYIMCGAEPFLDNLANLHFKENQRAVIKEYDKFAYLVLLSYHALGAGGYVILCQDKYNKPVQEFSDNEIAEIFNEFNENSPIDLFLNKMGIEKDSGNKKCLDKIVVNAVKLSNTLVGDDIFKKDYLDVLLTVMFNSGVTIVMR